MKKHLRFHDDSYHHQAKRQLEEKREFEQKKKMQEAFQEDLRRQMQEKRRIENAMKEEDEIYVEQLRAYSMPHRLCMRPLNLPFLPCAAAVVFAEKNKQEWDAEERRRREERERIERAERRARALQVEENK